MTSDAERPTIAVRHVDELLHGARAHGLDCAALLARAGIAPALLDAPLARVTQAQFATLQRLLRRTLRDELWGLCRRPVPPGSYAQALQLMVRCATLGEALDLALRQYRPLLSDFVPRLHLQGVVATVVLRPAVPVAPPLEYALRTFSFLGYGTLCWLAGQRVPLLATNTPHQRVDPRVARQLFQATVQRVPGWTGWTLERHWLDLRIAQTPQTLRPFLRRAPVGLLLKYRDPDSLAERVRALLRSRLAEDAPSLADIARRLGLSPETVRRRLTAEGHSYRSLKDRLRRDLAVELLAQPRLTLADIGRQVGFSEAATFHRAFRQWTGVAPGEYRATRLQAGAGRREQAEGVGR